MGLKDYSTFAQVLFWVIILIVLVILATFVKSLTALFAVLIVLEFFFVIFYYWTEIKNGFKKTTDEFVQFGLDIEAKYGKEIASRSRKYYDPES